jgi:hypothetical protein
MQETPQPGFSSLGTVQQSHGIANVAPHRHLSAAVGKQRERVEDIGSRSIAAPSGPSVGYVGQSGGNLLSWSGHPGDSGGNEWLASALDDRPPSQIRHGLPPEPPVFSQDDARLQGQDRRREATAVAEAGEDEDEILWLPAGRHRYDKAIGFGYIMAVKLAWQHAIQNEPSVLDMLGEADWTWHGYNVLLSMQKDVLTAVASGNLASLFWGRENKTVCDMFQAKSAWMKEGEGWAPAVYIMCLVDSKHRGHAHTPDELRLVIDDLRCYGNMDWLDYTFKVDNAYRPTASTMDDIKNGKPNFLSTIGVNGRTRTRYKAEDIKRFCDALEVRLQRLPADEKDIPLRRPLQYIGRANKYVRRQDLHRRGDRSNWLMQLVKHVCHVRWPGRFNLDAFPVSYQAKDSEVACAQMLLALIADSFAATGGGFNRAAPVLSKSGISSRDSTLLEGFWDEREDFRDTMGFRVVNKPAQQAFNNEVKAVNARGVKYDPSKTFEGTQDIRSRTVNEGLAKDKAEVERLRREWVEKIARLDEQIEQERGGR